MNAVLATCARTKGMPTNNMIPVSIFNFISIANLGSVRCESHEWM
jgi:hypothetical protein